MKYKIFDVIELNNGNKATIVDIDKSELKIDVVDKNGISQGFENVNVKDIKKVIFAKE